MTTALDVLKGAAKALADKGWHQGSLECPTTGGVCLEAALDIGAYGRICVPTYDVKHNALHYDIPSGRNYMARKKAADALRSVTGDVRLHRWNDVDGRAEADVHQAITSAHQAVKQQAIRELQLAD